MTSAHDSFRDQTLLVSSLFLGVKRKLYRTNDAVTMEETINY